MAKKRTRKRFVNTLAQFRDFLRDSPSLRDKMAQICAEHEGKSGFLLLKTGSGAFVARRAIILASRERLDLQYYILQDDLTGKLLIEEILRAADRGVKVRLLLDDLDFRQERKTVLILDNHENIEIRVFNPAMRRGQRWMSRIARWSLTLERYSKRMHNKALTGDGVLCVTGGRNLGDEYFDARAAFSFNDLDVLAIGPVVERMNDCFEEYWEAEAAYTLEELGINPPSPRVYMLYRLTLEKYYDDIAHMHIVSRRKPEDILQDLYAGTLPLIWAESEVLMDAPDKVFIPVEKAESPPMERLEACLEKAQTEFIAVSPYFIPADGMAELFHRMTQREVKVRILTNSLASTDVSAVHAAYSRYRPQLLQNGVELFELKPITGKRTRSNLWRKGSSRSSLHAKVYVIDRQWVVVGSMNLDPRSRLRNTETMLFIRSEEMAEEIADMFGQITASVSSYGVRLGKENRKKLEWHGTHKGKARRFPSDPSPGLLRRLTYRLFFCLVPEDQL